MNLTLLEGDVLERLGELGSASFDALLTDPPYGLSEPPDMAQVLRAWLDGAEPGHRASGFMGAAWDALPPEPRVWREVLRVLKPGAFGLVFAGARTVDLTGLALRLAGFEVRDTLGWCYSQGMPHGVNVSKAIDAARGLEREVVGRYTLPNGAVFNLQKGDARSRFGPATGHKDRVAALSVTAPASPEAAAWDDYHSALKPALEPVLLVRKPHPGTFAQGVLTHGCGALNVGACRVPAANTKGRFPGNVLLDEGAAAHLDEAVGTLRSGAEGAHGHRRNPDGVNARHAYGAFRGHEVRGVLYGDAGGPSRFFPVLAHGLPLAYCAKAPRAEREAGVGDNAHPCVKPLTLTRWLATLLLPPPRDTPRRLFVPYSGVGSEFIGALLAGWDEATGIEQDPDYNAVARARLEWWAAQSARLGTRESAEILRRTERTRATKRAERPQNGLFGEVA